MHVRYTSCAGTPVVDDATDETVGSLSFPLLHPDLGIVEGFFVSVSRGLFSEPLFVSSRDILHWGTHVRIRGAEDLGPLSERVRLQAFVDEGRVILGQKMLTESGVVLGTCKDVQFNTKTFTLEWLFPRKLLRWGLPVPASAIVEVKPEAVMLRETAIGGEVVAEKTPILPSLEELTKVPTAGMAKHGRN